MKKGQRQKENEQMKTEPVPATPLVLARAIVTFWLHFVPSHSIMNWCHTVISSWDFQLDNVQKLFPPKCFIPSLFYILAIYPAHRNLLHFTVLTTPDFLLRSHRKTGFRSDHNSQFDELTSNSIISLKPARISTDNTHTSHDICL
jgi:hypothetical protein